MAARAVWLAYSVPKGELKAKRPQLHRTRDAGAYGLLMGALGSMGYEPGPQVFNFRGTKERGSWIRADDLIILTTRPPLSDHRDRNTKRRIDRSGTDLETRLLAAIEASFLSWCSRSRVTVSIRVRDKLYSMQSRRLADVKFEINRKAWPKLRGYSGQALGYLLYLPKVWVDGPRFLSIFGLGGAETLLWAYLLATRYRGLLTAMLASKREGFAILKFDAPLRDPRSRSNLDLYAGTSSEVCRLSLPPA